MMDLMIGKLDALKRAIEKKQLFFWVLPGSFTMTCQSIAINVTSLLYLVP